MDFNDEVFQDVMAECDESALSARRALACLNRRWNRKVRAGFLNNPELKVRQEDCTHETVYFICQLARPGVHEFLVLRIADPCGEEFMPTLER